MDERVQNMETGTCEWNRRAASRSRRDTGTHPVPSGEPTECEEGVELMLQDGTAAFTGRFLYEALKGDPNENNIMSAFSVLTPLSQLALYSDGDTMNQLLRVLNLPNKSNIRCVFPPLISNLRAEENVVLNVASRIFATDRYPLSEEFLADTKKVFDSQAENLDFSKPRDAANRINQWVESQTNDRIKDIAKPDMFDGETRLVLANAIYFLGNWIFQFKETSTSNRTFYLSNGTTVEVETMYQKNCFKYGESSELDCKVLEMFYQGGNFSFLPNKVDGLLKLVENLQDSSKLYAAYEATRYEEVEVYLPKMKIESGYDLSPIMNAVGITDVLNRKKSNLNGILKEYKPLYISKAVQKAFVQVDEKGTEAAAANVRVGGATISFRLPPLEFKADHPFAFYIFNKNNIIFSGAKVK